MVTWTASAHNDLASIWISALDRQEVTQATHRIDQALKRDPDKLGRPIGDDRIYVDRPLAVTFTVSIADCRV
jgi:hypothetical protein